MTRRKDHALEEIDPQSADYAAQRQRKAIFGALTSVASKSISISCALFTVPLLYNYLDASRYGLWVAITSITSLLVFGDLGIGSGLVNAIASANTSRDPSVISGYIRTAITLLIIISTALLCLFLFSRLFVFWPNTILPHNSALAAEADIAILIVVFAVTIGIPASLTQRVQLGHQEGVRANIWQLAGTVASFSVILLGVAAEASISTLLCASLALPVAVNLLNGITYFQARRHLLAGSRWIDPQRTSYLLRQGSMFAILQLISVIAYGLDSLIIIRTHGPDALAEFAVPERMFSIVTMAGALALTQLWPAYREALNREDYTWVRKTLIFSTGGVAVLTGASSFVLMFLAPWLAQKFVNQSIGIPGNLLVALASWKTLEAAGTSVGVFLAAYSPKLAVWVGIPTAIGAVAFKIIFTPAIGSAAIPMGSAAAYVLFTAIPLTVFAFSKLRTKGLS